MTGPRLVVDQRYYDRRDLNEAAGIFEDTSRLGKAFGPIKAGVTHALMREQGDHLKPSPWKRQGNKYSAVSLAKAAGCTPRLVRELTSGQTNRAGHKEVYQDRMETKLRAILRKLGYTEAEFMELVRAADAVGR